MNTAMGTQYKIHSGETYPKSQQWGMTWRQETGDNGDEERYTEGGAESAADQVTHTEVVGTSALLGMKPTQWDMTIEEAALAARTIVTRTICRTWRRWAIYWSTGTQCDARGQCWWEVEIETSNARREIDAINIEHYPTGFPTQGIIPPPSPPTHSFSSNTLQTGQSSNPTNNARRGRCIAIKQNNIIWNNNHGRSTFGL